MMMTVRDDDLVFASEARAALVPPGCQVEVLDVGAAAVQRLANEPLDVVVASAALPGIHVSTVAFVAGGVLTAAGVGLVLFGGDDDESVAVALQPAPTFLTARGRF